MVIFLGFPGEQTWIAKRIAKDSWSLKSDYCKHIFLKNFDILEKLFKDSQTWIYDFFFKKFLWIFQRIF